MKDLTLSDSRSYLFLQNCGNQKSLRLPYGYINETEYRFQKPICLPGSPLKFAGSFVAPERFPGENKTPTLCNVEPTRKSKLNLSKSSIAASPANPAIGNVLVYSFRILEKFPKYIRLLSLISRFPKWENQIGHWEENIKEESFFIEFLFWSFIIFNWLANYSFWEKKYFGFSLPHLFA